MTNVTALREPPHVAHARMSLYPTYDSTVEAVKAIEAQCPLDTPNKIFAALMTYHNTLLKELEQGTL